jgi:hypothetical protein
MAVDAAVVDPIHSDHADDDRCTVVQPSKRFRPDVQRFAPTLRDHADAGITESMAVDAAVVDPIPNEHADFSDPRIKRSTVTSNLSDLLTKALDTSTFRRLRDQLMYWCPL